MPTAAEAVSLLLYGVSGLLILIVVADRRGSEASLRRERDRARLYFETAGVMLLVLQADRRVRRINRHGAEILGLPANEIVGKDWVDTFIPARLRATATEVFEACLRGNENAEACTEGVVLRADGAERVIAWRNTLLSDEQGRVIGVLSSGEDVTDRRRAQQALRDSEARFRVLAEIDAAARLVDASRRLLRLLEPPVGRVHRRARKSAPGPRMASRRSIPTIGRRSRPRWNAAVRGLRGLRREVSAARPAMVPIAGSRRAAARCATIRVAWCAGSAHRPTSPRSCEAREALEERVAERTRELEEVSRRLVDEATERAKAEAALARVQRAGGDRPAHRRRGPRLQQPAHRHRRQPGDDPALGGGPGSRASAGDDGARRGRAGRDGYPATAGVLAPAGAQTGSDRAERADPQFRAIRPARRRRGVRSAARRHPRRALLPRSIRRNSKRRSSTLSSTPARRLAAGGHIVDRDARAADRSSRTRTIRRTSRELNYVVVVVRDDGCGIPADVLPRVFDPFFTTKDVGKGSGLGLSQVYGFVRQSGGNVRIESQPGDRHHGAHLSAARRRAGDATPNSRRRVRRDRRRRRAKPFSSSKTTPEVLEIVLEMLRGLNYSVRVARRRAGGARHPARLRAGRPVVQRYRHAARHERGRAGSARPRAASETCRSSSRPATPPGRSARTTASPTIFRCCRKPYRLPDLAHALQNALVSPRTLAYPQPEMPGATLPTPGPARAPMGEKRGAAAGSSPDALKQLRLYGVALSPGDVVPPIIRIRFCRFRPIFGSSPRNKRRMLA